ncbi:hypothetical protein HOH45_00700, partial [bacterium]|nr:hypothetical protein [bacterium]
MLESLHHPTNGSSSTSKTIQYNDNSRDTFTGYALTSQDSQTASKMTDKDGNVHENLERAKAESQKASKRTNKDGTVYENWKVDKDGSQTASEMTNKYG